ncbi:MAG: hypothetical protein A3C02_00555 [Candidatus Andersenbacteria bacterium RIFCSPHIGHO2_02_FULL_45_11]|uniref:Uncharacterized protein n=1 Tax=Candidatus Andersenbacteria bacterium RIFCSPHIGHO2_12_FULL_45_11 TaxID=1797281 RepID=A0A1G1X394_9BACT|nr:MAG: hypothetical protein A2805_02505 [Candidatus Andersenbacteria bacterium RIFCSPHIGHO2_01_FULL_46_36]OGY31891.1 MAG: hypothetical protein A3C02_00555 [Candidatus Andersenbacteria bacterium RIFCSPHIGHO2_02_FULL_45_11]OGY34040.1 MAG: hypothetical protein A3D99_02165 [Candidatus Andersenbacteria bacterium RIFCSPHIGHO2_12_FULL_45_11]
MASKLARVLSPGGAIGDHVIISTHDGKYLFKIELTRNGIRIKPIKGGPNTLRCEFKSNATGSESYTHGETRSHKTYKQFTITATNES